MRFRNKFTGWSLLIFIGLVLCLDSCHRETAKPSEPTRKKNNILIVTMDTLRADHLSCYGYPRSTSPTLDRLAQQGVLLRNVICAAPFTNPSHAALFTGLYPWENGCRSNYIPLDNSMETLAEVFRKKGYHTGAFVSGSPLVAQVCGLNQGFETYDDEMTEPVYRQRRMLVAQEKAERTSKKKTGNHAVSVPYSRRTGDKTVASALTWLEQQQAPWFLWVHLYDIHGPYRPMRPLGKLFEEDTWDPGPVSLTGVWIPDYQRQPGAKLNTYINHYDAAIYTADHYFNMLIRKLSADGFLKNTCIAVLADHGESLGENNYGFDHGKYLYQCALQIPVILRLPGAMNRMWLNSEFFSETDLFSLLQKCASGQDAGLLKRRKAGNQETHNHSNAWRYAETKPVHPLEPTHRLYAATNGIFKYIYASQTDKSEYYDLETDPGEHRNIALQHPERIQNLRKEIEDAILNRPQKKIIRSVIPKKERQALKSLGYIEN